MSHFQGSRIETLHLGRDLETETINGYNSNGSPFSNNSYLKNAIFTQFFRTGVKS